MTISQDNGQILSIRRIIVRDEMRKKINTFVHYKFLPGLVFTGLGLIHTIGGLSQNCHGGAATVDRRWVRCPTSQRVSRPADYGSGRR